MDNLRIGVDMDGVIAYSFGSFIKEAWKRYKIAMNPDDATEFAIENCYPGITKEIVKEIFTDPMTFYNAMPILLAIESLNFLNDIGSDIFILTDRPENCRDTTERWLQRYRVPYSMMELVKAKDKPEICKKFNLKYFIEDRRETTLELANVCETVFLLDRTYNKGELPYNVRRVSGWDVVIAQMFYPTVVSL